MIVHAQNVTLEAKGTDTIDEGDAAAAAEIK